MLEEDACGQSRRQRSVRVVHSAQFSLDGFLVAALADVPLRADYIGADPRKATSTPASTFPAQWRDVCALTTPPNGFVSQPWWNDKVQRKHQWQARGVDARYLVPTLYHSYVRTESVYKEDAAGFLEDESGQLALTWDDPTRIHRPHDPSCQVALERLLLSHRSFVLKPIEGNRAEGVQFVRAEVGAESSEDFAVTVQRHTSEPSLIKSKEGERMLFSEWFRRCVTQNQHIKTGILVEPMIEWDNEVTCISLAGGEIIVMGSKGGGLVRSGFAEVATRGSHRPVDPVVVAAGREPVIVLQANAHDPRREKYQLNTVAKTAPASLERSPSHMLVECRDASGQRLWEIIRDSIRIATHRVSITRVDFFVKYPRGEGDDGAAVFINEVEHGFDAGLLPSWFGMQMAELISKCWVYLGASQEAREEYVQLHGDASDSVGGGGEATTLSNIEDLHPADQPQ